jgi:hypothetical protein
MLIHRNPDNLAGTERDTPSMIADYVARQPKPVLRETEFQRTKRESERRRTKAINFTLWLVLGAILAAAHYFDPCRPDAARCSEVSR